MNLDFPNELLWNKFGVTLMKTHHKKYKLVCTIFISIIFIICLHSNVQAQYKLIIHVVDKDSVIRNTQATRLLESLPSSFLTKALCTDYIYKLPITLSAKGFLTASVDSSSFDSTGAHIYLYLGRQFKWLEIQPGNTDKRLMDATGWNEKHFVNKKVDYSQILIQEQRMLDFFDNSGYPFVSIALDSLSVIEQPGEDGLVAKWKVTKGPLYHIDSIRLFGKVKIKNSFLQRYLGISNGSIYNKGKLNTIGRRLLELPYLQEQQHWDITMLGTGSVLNLYLQPRRSSQVNFLIGFLPGSGQSSKTQITGDVNLNLKNALGAGESILLNWQQLQLQSPRLNIAYQQPYIFNSPMGVDFNFSLLKRDSTFLQLDGELGLQ